MECRVEDFRYKEVVNVCDGGRLGYVSDVVIDVATGSVTALIVPGRCKFLGLFWREEDYILPWDSIRRIGGDIVLVENPGEYRRGKREKRQWFTWSYEDVRTPCSGCKNVEETEEKQPNVCKHPNISDKFG